MNLKRKRAWHVISQMNDEWVYIGDLAKQAGLPKKEMACYLSEARKLGLLEHKVSNSFKNGCRVQRSFWRFRLNPKPQCPKCGHVLILRDGVFECVVCGVGWKPVSRSFQGEDGPNQSASKRGEKRRNKI